MPTQKEVAPIRAVLLCTPVLVAALVAGPALAKAGGAGSKPPALRKVAVMSVKTEGVAKEVGSVLTEVLTTEVSSLGRFEVMGASDIKTLLGFQAQKQMLGCTDDTACLAQIGGALGVDLLLAAQVGRIGSTYVVSVKLLRVDQSKVVARVSNTVSGKIDDVIGVLRKAVHEVFARVPGPKGGSATRGAVATTTATARGGSGVHVGAGPITFWALGAVGLGIGAGLGAVAASDAALANQPSKPGSQVAAESGPTVQTFANVGFAFGGAALVAGTVWLLLDHGAPRDEEAVNVAPVVGPRMTGAVAVVHF